MSLDVQLDVLLDVQLDVWQKQYKSTCDVQKDDDVA